MDRTDVEEIDFDHFAPDLLYFQFQVAWLMLYVDTISPTIFRRLQHRYCGLLSFETRRALVFRQEACEKSNAYKEPPHKTGSTIFRIVKPWMAATGAGVAPQNLKLKFGPMATTGIWPSNSLPGLAHPIQ